MNLWLLLCAHLWYRKLPFGFCAIFFLFSPLHGQIISQVELEIISLDCELGMCLCATILSPAHHCFMKIDIVLAYVLIKYINLMKRTHLKRPILLLLILIKLLLLQIQGVGIQIFFPIFSDALIRTCGNDMATLTLANIIAA